MSTSSCKANKRLQGTFDPLAIFAAAKTSIASNAPEPRRYPTEDAFQRADFSDWLSTFGSSDSPEAKNPNVVAATS